MKKAVLMCTCRAVPKGLSGRRRRVSEPERTRIDIKELRGQRDAAR